MDKGTGTPEEVLKRYWGYTSFRKLQKEIINSTLNGQDCVALLPTGGGKSICYQVPAICNEGVCLVITPLISLMEDQVQQLKEKDIPAICLHSDMHYKELKQSMRNLVDGAYKLVYVAPERLQSRLFQEYLNELDVTLIAVDEAHCVSQWGHDFRPDYLKIGSLRTLFPKAPVLAVTATATREVLQDISIHLGLRNPALFQDDFRRKNIQYEISYCEAKPAAVLALVQKTRGSAIIYCRSRRETEAIARMLQQNGLPAVFYHAGMSKERRTKVSEEWMNDRSRIMVATTAFGMGINKPDVRLVIHFDIPEHPEAWYQETGRAGRDGTPAQAVSFYHNGDLKRLHEEVSIRFPPEDYLRKVYQAVCEYLQVPVGNEPHQEYHFELSEFCNRFQLKAVAATYALRLLEQEELWTLTESVFRPATAVFIAPREDIDFLRTQSPDLAYLCTVLLRLYGSIYNFPTRIHIPAIARLAKMKQEEVAGHLTTLHRMKILEYTPSRDGSFIFFRHRRVHSEHLMIDRERITRLRNAHIKRTNAIIELFTKQHCREQFMLNYLGQQAEEHCGHCDYCISGTRSTSADGVNLRGKLISLLKQKEMSIEELVKATSGFPPTEIIDETRKLIDQQLLERMADGKFCFRK